MPVQVSDIIAHMNELRPVLENAAKFRGPELEEMAETIMPVLNLLEKDLDNCEIKDENDKQLIEISRVAIRGVKRKFTRNMRYDWKGIIILVIIVTLSFGMGCFSGYLIA